MGRVAEFLNAAMLQHGGDPAAAEDFLPAVEHGRLPGSNRALRFEELDARFAVRAAPDSLNPGRRWHMLVTDLHRDLQPIAFPDRTNPVHIADRTTPAEEFFVRPHHDAVALAVKVDDVERRTHSHPQSLSLPDCVVVKPAVLAQHLAAC